MSFSTFVRNRNSERVIALFSAIAVLMSLMAIYAPAAQAHDGTVEWDCDGWSIDLIAYSGATIEVVVDGDTVADTSFQSNYDLSGTWDDTQSHTLDIVVNAADDDDQPVHTLGSNGSFSPDWQNGEYSFTLDISQEACNQPPQDVTTVVAAGSCAVVQGQAQGSIEVTIDPASGATVEVFDGNDLVDSLTSSGTITGLDPGTYQWEATPSDGYQLTGDTSGTVTIVDCEVTVSVTANACTVNQQGQPVGSAGITIDPDSGATVDIYSDAAMNDLVTTVSSSGTVDLPPGTYYWEANDEAGFELTGDSEGQFTIDPCDATVGVAAEACTVGQQGQPAGSVDLTIDPDSGATVEIYSDAAMNDLVTTVNSSDTIDLEPGTYYWVADAAAGFDLTGDTSGQFTIDPCDVTVSASGVCLVQNGNEIGQIDVSISTSGAATVEITDAASVVVASLTQSGTVNVPAGADYTWDATAATGFAISGNASGGLQIDDCTPPPPPPEDGEIIVEKVVEGTGSQDFEFTFDTEGFDLADNTLAHGQSSSSGDLLPGTGYSVSEQVPTGWTQVSATCDDGSDPSNIDLAVGEVVTCTFVNAIEGGDSVLAAIEVTVEGSCEVDDDEGVGLVDITVSVADGATVVVRDSDGDVVGTVTSEGTIEVPEGATYTWEATPAEGFEFPSGADSSGSITVESCSDPETLPFTGIDSHQLGMFAIVLMGAGVSMLYLAPRKREE